jgi:hypothetical protein
MHIAISSHRPHAQSASFRENQIRALSTWLPVFDEILYYGDKEPELARDWVYFMPSEPFPTIRSMLAGVPRIAPGDSITIINSDIVLHDGMKTILRDAGRNSYCIASSRRRCADSLELDENDRGRDIWILGKTAHEMISRRIPDSLRIGHQKWDGWMYHFAIKHFPDTFIDFTDRKLVFHPKHGDRKMPHAALVELVDITNV